MKNLFIFFGFILIFSSCKIFKPNLMLKTPRDFVYDKLVDSLSRLDYKIAANDAIQYKVFTNDGFKLIDLASSNTNVLKSDIDVIVDSDGNVKMPLLGRFSVLGLTLKQAEKLMEDKYSEYYVKPFVTLRVTNKRVIIFPGNTGQARVVALQNNNTSVIEAIATAGGIPDDGKAYKIKLIRKNENPLVKSNVYLLDLSKIDGVMLANSKVQANDIIYVEPRYRPFKTIATELAPLVTLVTTVLILTQFYRLR